MGMGPLEILLILILALIVFGPSKLPEVAQGLGRAVREFRRATSDVARQVTLQLEDEVKSAKEVSEAPVEVLRETARQIGKEAEGLGAPFEALRETARQIGKEAEGLGAPLQPPPAAAPESRRD